MIGSSQAKIGKPDLGYRELGFSNLKENCRFSTSRVCFDTSPGWKKAGMSFTLKAIQSDVVPAEKPSHSGRRSKSVSFVCSTCCLWSVRNSKKEILFIFIFYFLLEKIIA